jgi:hypothetical protein
MNNNKKKIPRAVFSGFCVEFSVQELCDSVVTADDVLLLLQGALLSHNQSARIIRSNQSLVLQKVTRQSAGNYVCVAINREGETVSNELAFRVKCKS